MITFSASSNKDRPVAPWDFARLRRTTHVANDACFDQFEIVRDLPDRWKAIEATENTPTRAVLAFMDFLDAIADVRWRLQVFGVIYSLMMDKDGHGPGECFACGQALSPARLSPYFVVTELAVPERTLITAICTSCGTAPRAPSELVH